MESWSTTNASSHLPTCNPTCRTRSGVSWKLGPAGLDAARAATAGKNGDLKINDVVLDPVIPEPPAIWCVGLNYASHREETGSPVSEQPTFFLRIAASQVGQPAANDTAKGVRDVRLRGASSPL